MPPVHLVPSSVRKGPTDSTHPFESDVEQAVRALRWPVVRPCGRRMVNPPHAGMATVNDLLLRTVGSGRGVWYARDRDVVKLEPPLELPVLSRILRAVI
jgi:hypothetical protein